MGSGINVDEWLKATEDAGLLDENDQSAVTTDEYALMFTPRLTRRIAEHRLNKLVEQGLATKTHKRGPRENGRMWTFVAYKLAKG